METRRSRSVSFFCRDCLWGAGLSTYLLLGTNLTQTVSIGNIKHAIAATDHFKVSGVKAFVSNIGHSGIAKNNNEPRETPRVRQL